MKYLTIIAMCLIGAGCQTQKNITNNNAIEEINPGVGKLEAGLGLVTKTVGKDSVVVSFTVINKTGNELKFCKWETPFEPKLGKYFEITDDKGTEAQFHGAMARRVMPPPAEAYIKVPAHDSVRTQVNIARTYAISSGKYSIKYTGGGVSGLNKSNSIKLIIAP